MPTNLVMAQSNSEISMATPETCDKVTLTNSYDFNVAFIGGTDEYKVLNTCSRNINDPSQQAQASKIFFDHHYKFNKLNF